MNESMSWLCIRAFADPMPRERVRAFVLICAPESVFRMAVLYVLLIMSVFLFFLPCNQTTMYSNSILKMRFRRILFYLEFFFLSFPLSRSCNMCFFSRHKCAHLLAHLSIIHANFSFFLAKRRHNTR